MTHDDRRLLALVDAALAEGAARASGHLACRVGCTECCVGPFAITRLDAVRLGRALDELAAREPDRADRIRRRARDARDAMRPTFPGDPGTGVLGPDEAAEDAFCAAFETMPCPVLDPDTGACDLYDARPVSCRTFGPPVAIGDENLPPCRLCFTAASPDEIERARVAVDPDGVEDALVRALGADGQAGETIVAFAIR